MSYIKSFSPVDIERNFNLVKARIQKSVLNENNSVIPPKNTFDDLDKEFKLVEEIYSNIGDSLNYFHASHGYHWSKSFQYLENDINKSVEHFKIATEYLIKRENSRTYGIQFSKMINTFKVPLIKIISTIQDNKITNIQDYNSIDDLHDSLIKLAQSSIFKLDDFKEIESMLLSSICQMNKRMLHFILRHLYFEKEERKRKRLNEIVPLLIDELLKYSDKAVKSYKTFCRKHSDRQNERTLFTKQLDHLSSKYYFSTYKTKNLGDSVKTVQKIKQFLVDNVLRKSIPVSQNTLDYFEEEFELLNVYMKIIALKNDIKNKLSEMKHDWSKDVFNKIILNLEQHEQLFKYEIEHSEGFELKIFDITFSGLITEYFIHHLCKEYWELETHEPELFILKCIKDIESVSSIILNEPNGEAKPDFDIFLKDKSVILIKNRNVKKDLRKVYRELEQCKERGVENVFYVINFLKNIDNLENIRLSFEDIKKRYSFHFEVFDIEELINILYTKLKEYGKKLNFSETSLNRLFE